MMAIEALTRSPLRTFNRRDSRLLVRQPAVVDIEVGVENGLALRSQQGRLCVERDAPK
jgi:hypothetical protein